MSNRENSSKMKGLLKGLRFISQMFDDNKEQEIQIGFPTDVKHVAHIGWDGPATAASSPSWMNEFETPPGAASGPLSQNGETREDNQVKWVSEDSSQRSSKNANGSGELHKTSRRHSSRGHEGGVDSPKSPKREKSDKQRQTRRHSRRGSHQEAAADTNTESSLPDIPKKSRRKKSKESAPGGSSKKVRDPGNPCTTKYNSIEPQNPFQEGEDNGGLT